MPKALKVPSLRRQPQKMVSFENTFNYYIYRFPPVVFPGIRDLAAFVKYKKLGKNIIISCSE